MILGISEKAHRERGDIMGEDEAFKDHFKQGVLINVDDQFDVSHSMEQRAPRFRQNSKHVVLEVQSENSSESRGGPRHIAIGSGEVEVSSNGDSPPNKATNKLPHLVTRPGSQDDKDFPEYVNSDTGARELTNHNVHYMMHKKGELGKTIPIVSQPMSPIEFAGERQL